MNVTVLGGGSWGTALATHLVRAGHAVRLWVREAALARAIGERHENARYLPGVALPDGITVSTDLAASLEGAAFVLVVIPSEFCRGLYHRLAPLLPPKVEVVSATKGLEVDTLLRMSEVAAEEIPDHPVSVLCGPSFALEVAQGQPTAVVVASREVERAEAVQRMLSTQTLRAYSSDDVVGAELAAALKNVIAIAAGIVDGLGHGRNTQAALITRGLAEMTRLAVALGGSPETLSGLAGLGDLVLTCTGELSRNRRLGQALGAGKTLEEARAMTPMVAEGVRTTLAACALAERTSTDMPIAREMREVLHRGKAPRAAALDLMMRSLKRE
ncbi:MAG TPA: NAD(P)H-dependent glycerol-3-phosphate dehydrogenase [Vicinamibacteria bacterium]|nr:NAD(P)H-dependent glycerol-3-phosphate dehydrogenase [Vicinamibacteria bacterium]